MELNMQIPQDEIIKQQKDTYCIIEPQLTTQLYFQHVHVYIYMYIYIYIIRCEILYDWGLGTIYKSDGKAKCLEIKSYFKFVIINDFKSILRF